MTQLDEIKQRINYLYQTCPKIRLDVSLTHPKIELKNDPALIKGVYKNLFVIEEYSTGTAKSHTLSYVDVLTGNIKIIE